MGFLERAWAGLTATVSAAAAKRAPRRRFMLLGVEDGKPLLQGLDMLLQFVDQLDHVGGVGALAHRRDGDVVGGRGAGSR